nr:MAG TPA_asm: hypothetical protein [Bacteriophage sp.]
MSLAVLKIVFLPKVFGKSISGKNSRFAVMCSNEIQD